MRKSSGAREPRGLDGKRSPDCLHHDAIAPDRSRCRRHRAQAIRLIRLSISKIALSNCCCGLTRQSARAIHASLTTRHGRDRAKQSSAPAPWRPLRRRSPPRHCALRPGRDRREVVGGIAERDAAFAVRRAAIGLALDAAIDLHRSRPRGPLTTIERSISTAPVRSSAIRLVEPKPLPVTTTSPPDCIATSAIMRIADHDGRDLVGQLHQRGLVEHDVERAPRPAPVRGSRNGSGQQQRAAPGRRSCSRGARFRLHHSVSGNPALTAGSAHWRRPPKRI